MPLSCLVRPLIHPSSLLYDLSWIVYILTKYLPFNASWLCRGAAPSARQPGCPEHCGGASWRFDGPDADCWTLGRRAPHPNVFPGWGQLSNPHYGSAGCSSLTGQWVSPEAARRAESTFCPSGPQNWGRISMCSLEWVPGWDRTSQTCIPGGEGLRSPRQIQVKVFSDSEARAYSVFHRLMK